MGLDIYLSKKTFIGAMFKSRGISGIMDLYSHRRKIPIELSRVSHITEDIFYGRKTWWLVEWLDHELKGQHIENGEECPIETDTLIQLHKTCVEILEHKDKPDFRKICHVKLYYYLKDDMTESDLADFICKLESLRDATDCSEINDDTSFSVTASW